MRAVDVQGADIDAPWLFRGESFLRVNGEDVISMVEAELNRRFPGRAGKTEPTHGALDPSRQKRKLSYGSGSVEASRAVVLVVVSDG